jgi:hypothetical protein
MSTYSPIAPGRNDAFVKDRAQPWMRALDGAQLAAVKTSLLAEQYSASGEAAWFTAASAAQRQALTQSQQRRRQCRQVLSQSLKAYKGVLEFTEPLLREALRMRFGSAYDVHTYQLVRVQTETALGGLLEHYTPAPQSLMLAALHNFVVEEPFHAFAALAPAGSLQHSAPIKLDPFLNGVSWQYTGTLAIEPSAFATFCRQLDLGERYQEHLTGIFDHPDTRDALAAQMIAARKAELDTLSHVARLQKHIDDDGFTVLTELIAGRPATWAGQAVQCSRLSLLRSALHDIVLIGPAPGNDQTATPCLAWIPGDPKTPLKQYPSSGAFARELGSRLALPGYRDFFLGFIAQQERIDFKRRLQARLWRKEENDEGRAIAVVNTQPVLDIEPVAVRGELFAHLHQRHIAWLKAQGAAVAIPTATVDAQQALLRWEGYLQTGVSLLSYAGMCIPALGVVMLPIIAEQLLSEVYHGVEAWGDDRTDEAFSHFASVLGNLGLMVVTGGLAEDFASTYKNPTVDRMQPVTLASGEQRLWYPELDAYRSDVKLPTQVQPDAQGVYRHAEKDWIKLDGVVHEVSAADAKGTRRILHPSDSNAYQPPVEHNGAGAWTARFEQPLHWDDATLLRRLGPLSEGLDEGHLRQALSLTGVDAVQVRRCLVEQTPPPALLRDTLQRFQAERQSRLLIARLRAGQPLGGRTGYPLGLLTRHPRWPKSLMLKVYEGPEAWGAAAEYGNGSRVLTLQRSDIISGQLAERLLEQLDASALSELFGDSLPVDHSARLHAIDGLLADLAEAQRQAVLELYYPAPASVASVPLAPVLRDFPGLPTAVADEILAQATSAERLTLEKQHKVPLRLAQMARGYQREVRLNRAIEGIHLGGLTSADSDTLGFGLLDTLATWPSDMRLELRDQRLTGTLVQQAGADAATTQASLVRHNGLYQAYDAQGHQLNAPGDLYSAVLKALPDAQRRQLGLQIHDAESLRTSLAARASGDRTAVGAVLGATATPTGWRRLTRVDQRLGYPMSGEGRLPSARDALARQASALYPSLDSSAVDALLEEMSFLYSDSEIAQELERLAQDWQHTRSTLDAWVAQPLTDSAAGSAAARRATRAQVAQRIKACWLRETPRVMTAAGQLLGFELDLSELTLGELPALTARFDHVSSLNLRRTGLTDDGNAFISLFPHVRWLELANNRLTRLPEAITPMRNLSKLLLAHNQIVLSAEAAEALSGLTRLKDIHLSNNPLGRTFDVSAMTDLRGLRLSHTGIDSWPPGVMKLEALEVLGLRGNRISEIPDEVLDPAPEDSARVMRINRVTYLHDNPLSEASLTRLRQYHENNGSGLGIGYPGRVHRRPNIVSPQDELIPRWLQKLPAAEREIKTQAWKALQAEPNSQELFRVFSELTETADFQRAYPLLQARVWKVIEAASEDQAVRDAVFTYASHERTCSDGVTLVFSNLEVRAMVQQALGTPGSATQMLKLCKGLFRLEEVEKVAQADIQARLKAGRSVDDVEVQLGYRIALRKALELPGQPERMIFTGMTELDGATLGKAQASILAMEDGPAMREALYRSDAWVGYLRQQHVARFEAVTEPYLKRFNALEDDVSEIGHARYMSQLQTLQQRLDSEQRRLIKELTDQALADQVEDTEL